jgi:protein-disulfide isomerase
MIEKQVFKLPVPINDSDHMRGPADAPITVVKYGDFECMVCAGAYRALKKMTPKLERKVRLVFRHFPLLRVHPRALRAAEAAEAAAAQGRFWEMYDQLFQNADKLEDKHLRKYARKIGLELDRFDQELADNTYADRIQRDVQQNVISGITGTPTFYINDVRYDNSSDTVQLLKYLETL